MTDRRTDRRLDLRLPVEIRKPAATRAQVDRALCICTTLEEFDDVHALATGHDNFWCSAGVHPDNEGVREPGVADLVGLAQRPRVVAIGETGLDYYRLNGRSIAEMEWQRERFRVHIRAARENHEREDYANAWAEARRASRPLRQIMRMHWDNAVKAMIDANTLPEDLANENLILIGKAKKK